MHKRVQNVPGQGPGRVPLDRARQRSAVGVQRVRRLAGGQPIVRQRQRRGRRQRVFGRRRAPVHGVQGQAGRDRRGHDHAQRHGHRLPVDAVRLRPGEPTFAVRLQGARHGQAVLPSSVPVRVERRRPVHCLLARVQRVRPDH